MEEEDKRGDRGRDAKRAGGGVRKERDEEVKMKEGRTDEKKNKKERQGRGCKQTGIQVKRSKREAKEEKRKKRKNKRGE